MRFTLLLFAVLLTACPSKPAEDTSDPVVIELLRLDGMPHESDTARIRKSAMDLALARQRFARGGDLRARPLPKALREHTIRSLIERRLLLLEAERLGVKASTTAVAKEMTALKAQDAEGFERILIETYQTEDELRAAVAESLTAVRVLEKGVAERIDISEKDLRDAFDALSDEERTRPERIHARQIMVNTEDEATALHRKLRWKPDTFADAARKSSVAPEAGRGGDIGWFSRGQMPEVFDELCFPLKVDEISPVLASPLGFHICQVLEREATRPYQYEELKPELRRELRIEAEREAKEAFIEKLERDVQIRRKETANS